MNENNISGTLKSVIINGSAFKIGDDNSTSEENIIKLFGGNDAFELYKNSTDGTFDAATVYNEIDSVKDAIDTLENKPFADQIETLTDEVVAAKTTISKPSGEKYLNITTTIGEDGHSAYGISTTGIDDAISAAVNTALEGNSDILETLQQITDWISNDTSGTAAIVETVAGKADKVSNATSGDFASIDANGNLTDSGVKASDFQLAGNYKTTQTAVSDPTANGTAVSFIASIQQNANGNITATKKTVQTADANHDGLMSASNYSKLSSLTQYTAGNGINIGANGELSIDTTVLPQPQANVAYADVTYNVQTADNVSGSVSIDGSKPIHVLTLTGDVTAVTLSTLPSEGHSTHVFFCSSQQRSVTITHHNTDRVCPQAQDLSLTVTANGYAEVDFLKANNKVYVRGV